MPEHELRAVDPTGVRRDILIRAVGQHDNTGDIMLRRRLLRWMRPLGRLHVYTGQAPQPFIDGLELGEGDIVYRRRAAWVRRFARSLWDRRGAYAFKPGEVRLPITGSAELLMLPFVAGIRAAGNPVVRLGVGARHSSPWGRWAMIPSVRLSSLTTWRDERTASEIGLGAVAPDLAFAEGSSLDELCRETQQRDLLVLSFRSDRAPPSPQQLQELVGFAHARGLGVVAIAQVGRDRSVAMELGHVDGIDYMPVPTPYGVPDEASLRAIYRRAAAVISDRLHVLICGLTEGAVPLGLHTDRELKIGRHFEVLDLHQVSVNMRSLGKGELPSLLDEALANRDRYLRALADARRELAGVAQELERCFSPTANTPARTRDELR